MFLVLFFFPSFFQIMPLRPGIQTLMMHHRHLCSTAAKSDSGEGQKSDQSSDAGKAVRGGVIIFILNLFHHIFFLFFSYLLFDVNSS